MLNRLLHHRKSDWLLLVFIPLIYLIFCYNPENSYKKEIDLWKHRADSLLVANAKINATVDSLQLHSDSVNVVAAQTTREVIRLNNVAARLRTKNDSVLIVLKQTLPDTCGPALKLAESYRQEADTLRVALVQADVRDSLRVISIRNLTQGLTLERQMNDSLVRLVKTVPVYRTPKLLGFISYPSRKVSFIAGAVVGVVAMTNIVR